MFVDRVEVYVKAGKGGDGAVAFRREKYVPKGGPSGGKGGNGGSVIFVGEEGLTTLLDFRYMRHIEASDGVNGGSKDMYGKDGENRYVKVPIGTTIIDGETNTVIGDITQHAQEVVVAKGGKGGRGNAAFATARFRTPDFAEKGEKGEERKVILDLKVLADVGLVGFPSVGKSTLISVVSAAKPKIAEYHFTTLNPNLGVVGVPDGRSFIMADLPGLIEGAHLGTGLGIQFLKHIERTRVIVHIIDMSGSEGRKPWEDYEIINKELESYNMDLLKRPQIVVANKMDLPEANENLKVFKEKLGIEVIPISAITSQNLNALLYKIADTLDLVRKEKASEIAPDTVVEYTFKPQEPPFTITRGDDGIYQVTGPEVKKLWERTDFQNESAIRRFAVQLHRLGIDDELRRLGVKNGDTVRIFEYEFEFTD
ncbi:MAG: GTPase Obg [Tenericutes bacterium ADurb.Bin140]|jgi:GTP-binding protein|nr:MAG: GTPase Obg [Tenericutes bacterium ADurb.Bin140]